jgi:hypothetical protein
VRPSLEPDAKATPHRQFSIARTAHAIDWILNLASPVRTCQAYCCFLVLIAVSERAGEAAHWLGLRVSIVGFDDLRWPHRCSRPHDGASTAGRDGDPGDPHAVPAHRRPNARHPAGPRRDLSRGARLDGSSRLVLPARIAMWSTEILATGRCLSPRLRHVHSIDGVEPGGSVRSMSPCPTRRCTCRPVIASQRTPAR